ncbi:hypothetical protein AZF37_01455 [endosymbiont 'TC1' of Trimyema compressum]|uniref:MoaD/ThiS family protein n=1 Tax=endosymbiont 'TC1' of Trimyema compressum TaxID=243899 RepID=UPI0007F0C98C|nr:MoaD/ThiS family protein [endosymbiont 'TC1' of Trimyema compressum]AMP20020.1 hypothetical protein AZF37_01455 [endosymbiont 'TC1' of Trimyema compressum]
MIQIEVKGVGFYRDIFKKGHLTIDIPFSENNTPTVFTVLKILDELYKGEVGKELYLEDGTITDWSRILLNGRDIRFLAGDKLYVKKQSLSNFNVCSCWRIRRFKGYNQMIIAFLFYCKL